METKSTYKIGNTNVLFTDNALITFRENNPFEYTEAQAVKVEGSELGVEPIGENNDLPEIIRTDVQRNPVASRALEWLPSITYGKGLAYGVMTTDEFGVEKIKEKTDIQEINDFLKYNNIQKLVQEAIMDIEWWSKCYFEIILNRESNPALRKVVKIRHKDYMFSRLEKPNPKTGTIENHYYSSLWASGKSIGKDDYTATPLLAPEAPITDILQRLGVQMNDDGKYKPDKNTFRYIYTSDIPSPGKKIYQHPAWWSLIQGGWLEYANKIVEFKKALLANQTTLKYHIEYPDDYFTEIFNREGLRTKEEQEARRKLEFANMHKYLKGTDNAGKSMITYYSYNKQTGAPYRRIEIKILDNKFKGGEYIDDSNEASVMIYTALGVHPALVGIVPGKQSTTLSGADKSVLIEIAQMLTCRKRQAILSFFELIAEVNNWQHDIIFYFKEIELAHIERSKVTSKLQPTQ